MGYYYSLYEWFNPLWLSDKKRFVDEHFFPQFKDLVTKYKPSIIFSEGEKSWDRVDFISIHPKKFFVAENYFCDEDGNRNTGMPVMHWDVAFEAVEEGTKVAIEITFEERADLEKNH